MYYDSDYTLHYSITLIYVISCYISYKYQDRIPKINTNIIKRISFIHNINLIIFNLYIFLTILYEIYKKHLYFFGNDPNDTSNIVLNRVMYLFYISKYYDYIDTIIIVLNRNFHQLSYLHVFHHSTVSTLMLYNYKLVPYCGDMYFAIMYNSIIHVLLYYYYLLSSLYTKKTIWWAKYFTAMQLVQFVFCNIQQIGSLTTSKKYPAYIREINILYGSYMFYLFIQFYIKRYIKRYKKI